MVANNVEEPHMGASQDKLSDSSAASSDASHITEHSPIVGKLEYLRGAPEVRTFPSFHKISGSATPLYIHAHLLIYYIAIYNPTHCRPKCGRTAGKLAGM